MTSDRPAERDLATGGDRRSRSDSGREAHPDDASEVRSARADVERIEHDHHGAEDSTATNPSRAQSATPTPESADGAGS